MYKNNLEFELRNLKMGDDNVFNSSSSSSSSPSSPQPPPPAHPRGAAGQRLAHIRHWMSK